MSLNPISTYDILDTKNNKIVNIRDFKFDDFILPFEHSSIMAGFALRFSNDKTNGYYVEIGSSHWRDNNNTYVLEKEFDWKGVGIEIVKDAAEDYNKHRSNYCINADALSFNWDKYFEENKFPKQIDFLQIDIDMEPLNANLLALLNLPLSRYRFSTIVIEHGSVVNPNLVEMKKLQEFILIEHGYKMVASGHTDDLWVDQHIGIAPSEYQQLSRSAWRGEVPF